MVFKKSHLYFYWIAFFVSVSSFAQQSEASSLLIKASEVNNKENLNLGLIYKMYRGFEKDSLTESYKITLQKTKDKVKMSFKTYETYMYEDFKITLDLENKLMYLNDPTSDLLQTFSSKQIEAFGKLCTISMVKSPSNNFTITMVPKLLEYFPYQKIELVLNKETYSVEKQSLYLKKKVAFVNAKGVISYDNAVLEIEFNERDIKDEITIPSSDYFINSNNNQFKVAQAFQQYQLTDSRTKK